MSRVWAAQPLDSTRPGDDSPRPDRDSARHAPASRDVDPDHPGPDASRDELAALRAATRAAADPTIRTRVNPRVGAALLDADGKLLGVAAHRGPGTPHAEVAAIAALPPGSEPHTAVVTLEPCAHRGNTGPCTEALLAAGVRRVVFAQQDPNPIAAGGGLVLAQAGLDVVSLSQTVEPEDPESRQIIAETRDLDPEWLTAARLGRPHVRLKLALTIDGRIAAADGSSRWITGPSARRDAHRLRARADAILVGTGTALADNPQLSVRDEHDTPIPYPLQPTRVVLGRRPVPSGARLHDASAPTQQLVETDPATALRRLYDQGVRRVFVEGGARIAAAFLRAGVVDELVTYTAPALLGAGPPAVADLGITTIADARRLQVVDVALVGDDVRTRYRPLVRDTTHASTQQGVR